MSLINDLIKTAEKNSGGIVTSLDKSDFGTIEYYIPTPTVITNLLYSGKVNGGTASGKLTMLAGATGSTKTLQAHLAIRNFQETYKDGVVIYVDAEHATEKEDLTAFGCDTSRIVFVPLSRIDDEDKKKSLMYNLSNLFDKIERGQKVLLVLDSLGALSSLRTNKNALSGNAAKDMSINSEKKKLINYLLEAAGMKGIPMILINHTYANVGGFGDSQTVAGGSVLFLPTQTIVMTSKAKMRPKDGYWEKDVDEKAVTGNVFTATIGKGRLAKQYSTAKFAVHFHYGFLKYSGLLDYALSGGYFEEGKDGRSVVYTIKGLEDSPKALKKSIYMPEHYDFWETLFSKTDFGTYLEKLFAYGSAGAPVTVSADDSEDVIHEDAELIKEIAKQKAEDEKKSKK